MKRNRFAGKDMRAAGRKIQQEGGGEQEVGDLNN